MIIIGKLKIWGILKLNWWNDQFVILFDVGDD